jgi:hypothetical protein
MFVVGHAVSLKIPLGIKLDLNFVLAVLLATSCSLRRRNLCSARLVSEEILISHG